MFSQLFVQIFALYKFFRKNLRKKRCKFSMDPICTYCNREEDGRRICRGAQCTNAHFLLLPSRMACGPHVIHITMIVLQRHSNTFQYSYTPPIEIDLWSLNETEPDNLHVPKTLSLDSISPASFLEKSKFLPCPLLHICPCSSHSPSYYPVPLHKSLRLFFPCLFICWC